jgi:predicted nucleic acid-binding protein
MLRYLLDTNIGVALRTQGGAALRQHSQCAGKQGQPIGVNDLHIAAHARSEGLTLVSNNLREFERVAALQLAKWAI